MTETQLKVKVLKHIRKKYKATWVLKTNEKFTSGVPDLIICFPPKGRVIAIELKIGKNKATKIQQWTLNQIHMAGGVAGVCRTLQDVDIVFNAAGI